MKRFFLLLLALALAAAGLSGCSPARQRPDQTSATAPPVSDTSVSSPPAADTSAAALPQTLVEVEALFRSRYEASGNQMIFFRAAQAGDFVYVFSDKAAEPGTEPFGKHIQRYRLSDGATEYLGWYPIVRCTVVGENQLAALGGVSYTTEAFFPQQYLLAVGADGCVSSEIRPYYAPLTEDGYVSGAPLSEAEAPQTVFAAQNVGFDGITFLIDAAEARGVGDGVPCAPMSLSYDAENHEMTLFFPRTDAGALKNLPDGNVFIESVLVEPRDSGTAVRLRLTRFARFYTVESDTVLSPEHLEAGQPYYQALSVLFESGAPSAPFDRPDQWGGVPENLWSAENCVF